MRRDTPWHCLTCTAPHVVCLANYAGVKDEGFALKKRRKAMQNPFRLFYQLLFTALTRLLFALTSYFFSMLQCGR